MKILIVNKFLYPKGGDAIAALNTAELLSKRGDEVSFWGMDDPKNSAFKYARYFVSNIDFNYKLRLRDRIKISVNLLYSQEAKSKIKKVLALEKPDLVHLHNFAHQISPSILHVLKKSKIPAVMTMHDYKLVCPTYSMLLNNRSCEKCRKNKFFNCFLNKCTKQSYSKSLLNTMEMYLHHSILNIYDSIDSFISPSIFLKSKLKEMGFKRKIIHLPNFIDANAYIPSYAWQENSIIYFGRLSEEKGLLTLVEAIRRIPSITLKIAGEGPFRDKLESVIKDTQVKNVNILGFKRKEDLINEIQKSMFCVLSSECYENNPLSLIEAFALGKPVVASRIGGIPELVKDHETGLLFEPANADDLYAKIQYFINNRDKVVAAGQKARSFIEQEMTPGQHYLKLISIYKNAANNKDLRNV